MKFTRQMVIIFALLSLMFFIQNCTPSKFASGESNKLDSSSEIDNNGQGYDGKIFVLMGNRCPDGTSIHSRITLKNSFEADLTRRECAEIAPVALGANEFQLNPNNSKELFYQNQTFVNQLVGTKLDMSLLIHDGGYCYLMTFDFGTPIDTANSTPSLLQVYEDGKPLGPAHAIHEDIRNIGLGLFSHKESSTGISTLRFSASDNSNPLTNGRTYTFSIK